MKRIKLKKHETNRTEKNEIKEVRTEFKHSTMRTADFRGGQNSVKTN